MTIILLDSKPARVSHDSAFPTHSVDQARVIYTGHHLYVATTPDRGRTVSHVYRFGIPDTESLDYYGRYTRIAGFSWSSCGCSSNWYNHTAEELVALGDSYAMQDAAEAQA